MYATTSFVSPLLHELVENFHSRRLLLHSPINQPSNPPISTNNHDSTSESSYLGDGNFDANVIMVLSVLLCALICSLGLNSIIRCALRCSNLVMMSSDHLENNTAVRAKNTGIKKKALKSFTTISYSPELNLSSLDSECVICLSEFSNGDKVRLLPKCNHGFHVRCIDKWLSSHSSCPKCRQCLIETCKKIVGSQGSSSQLVPETIVTIAPLEPEGLVRNYREVIS
ncbi:RING-H2 finger protein ATL78 [Cicer arietinum]|uniref:RING-type E3 ubiquitin transferase n=1 Tax=Cicer arietinum TaxID=3827 RepID=A0A1S2YCP1_CICAR|nr:RING-H2 finger protein ATL78 [Cicer arietinum]